jgi:hypothetical protein
MNQNNVKRASTATAKPKGARVRATKSDFALKKEPIGWHFKGKEIVPMIPLANTLMKRQEDRRVWRWQVAFWMAFAGFLAVSAMALIK